MSLQGYRRLAGAPSSSAGKCIASLRGRPCFLFHSSASPTPRSLIAPLHHAPFYCHRLGRRGLCWVRRTPPFPRSAGPRASFAQFLAEKTASDVPTHEEGLSGESYLRSPDAPVSSSNIIVASGSHSISDSSEAVRCVDIVNAAVTDNVHPCQVQPADNAMGFQPCDRENVDTHMWSCSNINVDIVDSECDINDDFRVVTDCLETATAEDNDIAQQSLIGLSEPAGPASLLESSGNSGSLLDAPLGCQTFLASPRKRKSGTKASRGPQLRRMLKSNHAEVKDCKNETIQWFPYIDQFKVKNKVLTSVQIMQMLGPYMLEDRKDRIKRVVANRTYAVCIVVEGLLDLGNIAAIFRTADALGFQSMQVISNETEKRYKKNRKISLGSEKWLDAELFKVTKDCFEELHARGYRVAVASVGDDSIPITDMDWTIPTAIVFGNEYRGVSTEALQWADLSCYIPMEGMVDSFNVSVAAGIMMHHAVNDRKARLGKHGDLSEEEQRILSADFYLRHNFRSLSVIEQLLQLKQGERQDKKPALMGDTELNIELPEQLKVDLDKVCAELYPV